MVTFVEQENLINRLLIYEQQPKSHHVLSLRKSSWKADSKTFIILKDSSNKQRAQVWGKTIHKLFKVNVLAVNKLQSLQIESYIKKHSIVSVIIIDLDSTDEHTLISTDNESTFSFLTNCFTQIEKQEYIINMDDVKNYHFPTLTTFIKLGNKTNLRKFLSFFQSYVYWHVKLSFAYKKSHVLNVSDKGVSENVPYNRLELHSSFLRKLNIQENDFLIILNPLNYKFSIVCVKSTTNSIGEDIIVSLSIRRKLELGEKSKVVIHPLRKLIVNEIKIQNVKQVADGSISVSPDLYEQIEKMGTKYVEIVNRVTAASIDVEFDKVRIDKTLSSGTIRLSYLQREFLNFEHPPDLLTPYYYESFVKHSKLQIEEQQFLEKHYKNKKVHEIKDYGEKQKTKNLLKRVGYYHAAIYPLPEKCKRKKPNVFKRVFYPFLKWTIRPQAIKLKVIRPYSTDESSNIVRLSKSVMSLLGIEENDLVQLHYRGRSITVPVLELASKELINETNIITNEGSINISIGVPAHLRDKLGIKQIGKICDVERDLYFLFRKSLNSQFLPIIGSIIAISQVDIGNLWLKISLLIVFLPVSSYFALSKVREKIPKL